MGFYAFLCMHRFVKYISCYTVFFSPNFFLSCHCPQTKDTDAYRGEEWLPSLLCTCCWHINLLLQIFVTWLGLLSDDFQRQLTIWRYHAKKCSDQSWTFILSKMRKKLLHAPTTVNLVLQLESLPSESSSCPSSSRLRRSFRAMLFMLVGYCKILYKEARSFLFVKANISLIFIVAAPKTDYLAFLFLKRLLVWLIW